MIECVIDASCAAAWFLPDEASAASEAILERYASGELVVRVPQLWNYEMLNLLRSAKKRGRISAEDLGLGLALLGRLRFTVEPQEADLHRKRILALAERHDLSAYDAAYLELADRFQIPLKSIDAKLDRARQAMGLPRL